MKRNARTPTAPGEPQSGLRQEVVARDQPARFDSGADGTEGSVAAGARPPQHLGARGPRGLLEYVVRRRLAGEARGSFPLKGSNWFERPTERTERAWRADVLLLSKPIAHFATLLRRLTPTQLRQKIGEGKNAAWLISGAAAHDLYHAGQIQLLKRFCQG